MEPVATAEGLAESTQPTALWLRRAGIGALALVVGASVLGLLGVRTAEVSAEGEGYRLTVHYPEVARAGLDTTYDVTVVRDTGFDQQLQLAVTGSYLDLFETQAFHPEPVESTRDGETLYLTFATEPGSRTFVVAYDAYLQPAAQRGRAATVSVVDDGRRVVSVDYDTRLLP